jgi:succinate-semialdehyde dehydrogenase / glutarate-semialdehyde dehydrogenase
MGRAETRRAIEAAKHAWKDWRRRPAKERSVLLRKWHDLMLANVEDLGKLMTAEQGKPLAEAKGEVGCAAGFIEWFAEEGKERAFVAFEGRRYTFSERSTQTTLPG